MHRGILNSKRPGREVPQCPCRCVCGVKGAAKGAAKGAVAGERSRDEVPARLSAKGIHERGSRDGVSRGVRPGGNGCPALRVGRSHTTEDAATFRETARPLKGQTLYVEAWHRVDKAGPMSSGRSQDLIRQ